MTYDELYTKLKECANEIERSSGKTPVTLQEVYDFLDKKLVKRKSRGAKSLRGLSL